jgi:hypothetical protein
MSVLTIAQIKGEIRKHLGGRTDADDRLDGVINLSQVRLARLHDFDELRDVTTIDTAVTADAAADKIIDISGEIPRYRKIYSIRLYADNQLSRKLNKRLTKNWDSIIPEPEYYARGTPTDYTFWGPYKMELWKVPDRVYTMYFRYSRWPVVVTSDTPQENLLDLLNVDDLIIHLATSDLIIHLATSYLYLSFGNLEKSNQYFAIYSALAKEAIDEDEEDFDSNLMSHDINRLGANTRGFDDPFVRSITTRQD